METTQTAIDQSNAAFWDELCGSLFARRNGITDHEPESLVRFDRAYLDYYPYLHDYVPGSDLSGRTVLEIGLGYGTVGGLMATRGLDYHGLDIAEGPVEMMRYRLGLLGIEDAEARVTQGSVLENPHPDDSFDFVVTIGCLHHTGDVPRAVSEVHRVLRPGGTATVMLYNRYSFRRAMLTAMKLPALLRRDTTVEQEVRRAYDATLAGEAAPVVDYTGKREARRLFSDFSEVRIRRENWDPLKFIRREWFLGNLAHLLGVDLYITAVK